MSKTLKLIDRLLAMARNFEALGRDREALRTLVRLAALRALPADAAEETQVRLAEILLRRRRHLRARRHLTAALLYQPDSARYHHLMATALDTRTDDANSERALVHYRRSLELDAEQPRCWSDYGRLCFYLGQVETGLEALRKSVELAPDDPFLVSRLVKGLCREGQGDEARRVVLAARFRNSANERFAKLYNDFMFRQLRRRQTAARQKALVAPERDCEVLLPFVRPTAPGSLVLGKGKRLRFDSAAPLAGTHTSHRPARRADWMHG